jgi:Uma2 family endonuclease
VPHTASASSLGILLGGPFQFGSGGGPGGWWILDEPELHLEDEILVPDVAGWRRERMPVLPDAAAFTLVPDWVCEVLSRSNAIHDRAEKLPAYAHHGVGHVWLLDPRDRALEVYRRQGAHWLLLGTYRGDARIRAEPFDAIELDLALLWAGSPVLPTRASEPAAEYAVK